MLPLIRTVSDLGILDGGELVGWPEEGEGNLLLGEVLGSKISPFGSWQAVDSTWSRSMAG